MTTSASPFARAELAANEATHATSRGPGLWQRFENFLRSVQMTEQESAVERFINANGGSLTDDLEREISRRFGNMAGDR
jgi:hypothetical protein